MHATMVILNYNDGERTARLAEKMSSYAVLEHIVLVDNCSTDDSLKQLQAVQSRKIHVVASESNGGYARGNNIGLRYAINTFGSEYLFVANPDIMAEESVLRHILTCMKENTGYGVMSCLVRQGYNVWNSISYLGIIESLFLIWFNLDKRSRKKKLEHSGKEYETVGVVEGSLFCIRRKAYCDIGGLDEGTFLYCEENILSFCLREKEYKVGVLTKEYYDHFHSASIRKQYHSKARAFHHFYNSFLYYLDKYLRINSFQRLFFILCYKFAYAERVIYDLVKKAAGIKSKE